jgi:hypothetical protein
MKAQSAVEFLTTYSFVLIILAAAILIIFTLVGTTRTEIKSQCVSFSTVACNFMDFYSNKAAGYSIATFSITNSQNAPISVANIIVTLNQVNFTGICAPNFLYQGEEGTCISNLTGTLATGAPVQGFFAINAGFCNSLINSRTFNCTQGVSYSGSFYAYSEPFPTTIYSVVAGISNSSSQLASYNSVPGFPLSNFIINNGDWVPKMNSTSIAYAYGTTGWTGNYFGIGASAFPQSLYSMNNNVISCSPSYNSILSFAYTGIYLPSATSLTFNAYADNAIAAWYLPQGSSTWNSIYGSSYWPASSNGLDTASATLGKGLDSIAVEWANTCGPGLQAFQISGNNV